MDYKLNITWSSGWLYTLVAATSKGDMNRQTKTEAMQAEVDVITNQCEFGSVLKGISQS